MDAANDFQFVCCECGRHIIVLVGLVPEPRLCAACTMMPGWFRNPAIRAMLDPDHDGKEQVERMPS